MSEFAIAVFALVLAMNEVLLPKTAFWNAVAFIVGMLLARWVWWSFEQWGRAR
jgi:hypothetical protein